MKNLPDKFPIRYAIVINDIFDSKGSGSQFNTTPDGYRMLFKQLLIALQENGLNRHTFIPLADHLAFKWMDCEIMNIAKLNCSYDWGGKIIVGMSKMVPEAKETVWSKGAAFNLGLYSYEGAAEIPSFMVARRIIEKCEKKPKRALEIANKFGNLELNSDTNSLLYDYERIRNNQLTNLQIYDIMTKYSKPIYISIPYSRIWEVLDGGFADGTVPLDNGSDKRAITEECELFDEKEYDYGKKKITVVICRSWEELFAEENLAIYKMLNFCNNCGKSLSFGYQGRYCQENEENMECIRERARKRASKKITSLK